MASSGVTLGFGVVVRIGTGATPSWTTLDGVADITFPTFSRPPVDVTHHGSPGAAREFIAGLRENGEITAVIHWVPDSATATLLEQIAVSGEEVQIELTAPNSAATRTFSAILPTLELVSPLDEAMIYNATFQVNAEIVAGP